MHPIDLIFLASFFYLPPLILLYLAEIWTILKPGSPFKTSFYILFVAGAIADLTMVAGTVHEFRLTFFPLVNGLFEEYDCSVCAQIRVTLSFICPFAQDLINCFVALNRLTSIRRPVQHYAIWRKLLPLAIPLFFFSPQLQHSLFRLSVIIIILYAIAARSLRGSVEDSARTQQELKLLIFGIANFLIMFPLFFLQVLLDFKFFPTDWEVYILYQFTWMIDVKCFGAAVTMIVVNTTFRKHMLSSFGRSNAVRSLSTTSQHFTDVLSRKDTSHTI